MNGNLRNFANESIYTFILISAEVPGQSGFTAFCGLFAPSFTAFMFVRVASQDAAENSGFRRECPLGAQSPCAICDPSSGTNAGALGRHATCIPEISGAPRRRVSLFATLFAVRAKPEMAREIVVV
jgi:hypothetical protein